MNSVNLSKEFQQLSWNRPWSKVLRFIARPFRESLAFVKSKSQNPGLPTASRVELLQLWEIGRGNRDKEVERYEAGTGFSISREWVDNLAKFTQVVKKKSDPNWNHGKLLYSALRKRIEELPDQTHVTVLETGTARGFSSICMARAILDAGAHGSVVSFDLIDGERPRLWNSISDHDGLMSRFTLLGRWSEELQRVYFVYGKLPRALFSVGLSRIHFAFLDAVHKGPAVQAEFSYVANRQCEGDVVVFDDVTPSSFPEVCEFVDCLEASGQYSITRIGNSTQRGYAIGIRQ